MRGKLAAKSDGLQSSAFTPAQAVKLLEALP
jgi:hypothetical protein